MQDVLNLLRDFDHDGQARLCARHLELLRSDLGEAWWDYSKDEKRQAVRSNRAIRREGKRGHQRFVVLRAYHLWEIA